MPAITITTFGYLHGEAPDAEITLDLRHFRAPHADPELRGLDARDLRVRRAVRNTPGISRLMGSTTETALAYLEEPGTGPVRIAVGGSVGRQRAASVGMALASLLRVHGHQAELLHRDIDKTVILRRPPLRPAWQRRLRCAAHRATIWHVRLAVAALLITTAAAIWIAAH